MNFLDFTFFQKLGIMLLGIVLASGFLYWCRSLFKNIFPNFKSALKYKIFKKKIDPDLITILERLTEDGIEGNTTYKKLLCNDVKPKRAEEMVYIQKLLKGGKK